MKALFGSKALLLLPVAAVAVSATVTGVVLAASSNANYTMTATPASQSVALGATASFAVNLSNSSGFSSTVTLSASGLPAGDTATFSPAQVAKGSGSSTLTIDTSGSSATGQFPITITGTAAGTSAHTASVTLNITQPTTGFTLSATPATQSILPGAGTTYQVAVGAIGGFNGAVALTTTGAVPSGVTVVFSPSSVTPGHSSTATVSTKNNTAAGTYTLGFAGTAANVPTATTSVTLDLSSSGKQFTVTGPTFGSLAPGVTLPLNLSIYNPNGQALSVTSLTVSVQSVVRATGVSAPCGTSDYTIIPFVGSYPLPAIAAGATRSLQDLGLPQGQWPTLSMANSLTRSQDGCKGATVTLAFTGAGQG